MFEKSGPDSLEGQLMWGLRAQIKELRKFIGSLPNQLERTASAPFGGPAMRGGYEDGKQTTIEEARRLCKEALDKQEKAW
jgi:hypothetical protein